MNQSPSQSIKITITIPEELNQSLINLADRKGESKSSIAAQLITTGMRIALAPTVDFGLAIEELNKSYQYYISKKQSRINNSNSILKVEA